MRKLTVIILFQFIVQIAFSQHTPINPLPFDYRNSVQLELGGHGLIYSLNYERILMNAPRFKTAVQAGFAYYPPKADIIDIWIPVLVNGILSFNEHHIEIGIGHVFTVESTRNLENPPTSWELHGFLTGRLGYRLQKQGSHFIMRAAFTPLINLENETEFHPTGGLSFGYAF
jgi:hypothetical protein